jgi:predicted XRE-type DNA-binding protein
MPPFDPIPDLKQQVGAKIFRLIATGNAWEIAVVLGTDQPRISELRRGKLGRFSLETLIRYAYRLRSATKLTFEPRPRVPVRTRVAKDACEADRRWRPA